jgi:hypothetical protein
MIVRFVDLGGLLIIDLGGLLIITIFNKLPFYNLMQN